MHTNNPIIKGIILIGGSGQRFDSPIPKQFHRIAGKKIYLYAVENFLKIIDFHTIILTCPFSWIDSVKGDLSIYQDPRLQVIKGGSSRQESSFLGLQACGHETDYVVIHDGARPFISQEILKNNIQSVMQYRAIDTCIPSTDTIVHATHGNTILNIPPRSEYWRGQTPQSFHYPLILQAHIQAGHNQILNSSDDCALVIATGHPIQIVVGSEENIKITTELDLFLAEQILRLQQVSLSQSSSPASNLKHKKIIITGGTGGIGSTITQKLQDAGAIPIPISRSTSPYKADFTSASQTQALFQQIQSDHGLIDGLINCFGYLHHQEINELSVTNIEQLIATNFTGVVYCCKWAAIKPHGHIINVASSSYIRGKKGYALYSAAKAAVVNFTQGLAEEKPNINLNAIIPQRTNTPMRHHHFPNDLTSELLDPNEIALKILTLLNTSAYTGATVDVRK